MSGNNSVSVLMPVYNAASCVRQAMDSILAQTYSDFELVIVNDGSTDDTLSILRSYSDSRIRILNLPQNKGLVAALNTGLDQIRADYIIRMDADEICHPERFARQIHFMESNPDVGISATGYKIIGGKVVELGLTHDAIKYQMLNRSPFPHSGIIVRGHFFRDGSLRYNSDFEFAEDLELWMRMIRFTRFSNIPEVLLEVTLNKGQLSRNLIHSSRHNYTLRKDHLHYLFPQLTEEQTSFLSRCLNRILPEPIHHSTFSEMLTLCNRLSTQTQDADLDQQLSEGVWFQLANNAPRSVTWLSILRHFNWIHIPIWKYGWLIVKPVVKRFRSLK